MIFQEELQIVISPVRGGSRGSVVLSSGETLSGQCGPRLVTPVSWPGPSSVLVRDQSLSASGEYKTISPV